MPPSGCCKSRRVFSGYEMGGIKSKQSHTSQWEAARVVSGSLVTDIDMAGGSLFLSLLHNAAGNCWLRQARNGRCQVLYKNGLSKEECCKTGRLTTSWTEEDVSDHVLFKWMIFSGGAPNCIPCKGGSFKEVAWSCFPESHLWPSLSSPRSPKVQPCTLRSFSSSRCQRRNPPGTFCRQNLGSATTDFPRKSVQLRAEPLAQWAAELWPQAGKSPGPPLPLRSEFSVGNSFQSPPKGSERVD